MESDIDEIRRRGLQALRRELGLGGMVKFLRQYFPGRGNWAKERHAWVDSITPEDIHRMLAARRARNGRSTEPAKGKRPTKPKKRRKVA
jgi:hypothetical protein